MNQRQKGEKSFLLSPLNHWRLINNWFLIEASSPWFSFRWEKAKLTNRITLFEFRRQNRDEKPNSTVSMGKRAEKREQTGAIDIPFVLFLRSSSPLCICLSFSVSFLRTSSRKNDIKSWLVNYQNLELGIRVCACLFSREQRETGRQAGTAMSLYDVSVLFNFRGKSVFIKEKNGLTKKSIEFVVELENITHVCEMKAIKIFIKKFVIGIGGGLLHLIQLAE